MSLIPLNTSQGQHATTLRLGESATFAIEENPTTGYHWEASVPADSAVAVTSDYVAGRGGNPGAAGERRITFLGLSLGRTTVNLDLRRSWEPPHQFQSRIALIFDVHP